MKKYSVLLALGCLLAGSLTPVLAAHQGSSAVGQATTPSPREAVRTGQSDAADWYNSTNPSQAELQAEYDLATENRAASAPQSYDYYYWQGYQGQLRAYL